VPIRVVFEAGNKRAFASALDWPGWSRSGKTEQQALETLASYAPRYAAVARAAGFDPPDPGEGFEAVERLRGGANTDFGVPHEIAEAERAPLSDADEARLDQLLAAAWRVFDATVAGAPPALRKGPRGGGRDRDQIVEHVRVAHQMYATRVEKGRWPKAYMVRRAAWHIVDHLWEIEDKSESA
jgi:hypothetical protein